MRLSRLALLPLLAASLLACGEGLVEGGIELHNDYRLPPPGMEGNGRSQALGGRQILFLNFEGGTVRYGQSDATANTSWIVQTTTTFPRFAGYGANRAASVQRIVEMVKTDYAAYDVEVVTTRPGGGAYTMVMIGGLPRLIGETEGVAGIAPLDMGNSNPSDIVFAFPETVWSDRLLANVISHEGGHSFGLEHLRPEGAIMYPVVHDYLKRWMNDLTYDSGTRQDEPSIYTRLFGLRQADPAPAPAPSRLAATFAGQTVPQSVEAGATFEATVQLVNTGELAWTAVGGIKLGSQAPADNETWGGSRVELGSTENVAPGQTKAWYVMFQAPATPGLYTFQWQMLKEGAGSFGDLSPAVSIEVLAPGGAAPAPEPAPAQDAIGALEFTDKSWGYGYAYDPDAPDEILAVQIFLDGRSAGTLDAGDDRQELVDDGTLPSAAHGFSFWMPQLPRGRHTVEAYAVDSDGSLKKLLGKFTLRYR